MHIVYRKKRKTVKEFWGMAALVVAASLLLVAFVSEKAEEKKLKAEATLKQWDKGVRYMDYAKMYLSKSTLPSNVTNEIIDSLSEFQKLIIEQLNPQLKAQDTTNKKPKN